MKIYPLLLSQTFPATHPRHGEPTYFKEKMHNALLWEKGMNVGYALNPSYAVPQDQPQMKLHTIRANFKLWVYRFAKIYTGQACLSLRVWSGKPYASKQIEIARLTKEDGIGLQALEFLEFDPVFKPGIWIAGKTYEQSQKLILAKNDGLSFDDWNAWFFGKKKNGEPLYDLTEKMAIIHFTSFRY
ncbi:MAG: hypothetical protein IJR42_01240 [Paludibacteraceae bacterium]|nr:hypothetical protein [Paludibacteraceae bacterium]